MSAPSPNEAFSPSAVFERRRCAPSQPRATPWVWNGKTTEPCRGGTKCCERNCPALSGLRLVFFRQPRALPWAGLLPGLWPSAAVLKSIASRPACFVGLAAFASLAHAQLPVARFDTVFPHSGKAGTEVEIAVTGPDLADLTTLAFDAPGFTATKIDALKFRVAIAPDCALGPHELRAVGRYGISTPATFIVGDAPEVLDPANNHARATAFAVPVPVSINGLADNAQIDVYKFTAKAGGIIAIAVAAQSLDSPMNPALVIRDAAGHEVARALNTRDRDAALEFTPPADGEYFAEVFDHLFSGGVQFPYRLTLATTQNAGSQLPPANSPATATLPDCSGFPAVAESEPNDSPAQAQKLALPCVVSGVLDREWFTFDLEKGRALWLEAVSERDGHPSDPLLVVYKITKDASGAEPSKVMLELDDTADLPAPPRWRAGSRDPAGKFVADETATYRVMLTDRFNRHAPYRLVIRDDHPEFALLALPESPANIEAEKKYFVWQPLVRRGGSAFFHIAALRRGYDGDIALRVEGLPPGLVAQGRIAAGAQTGVLVFNATTDAAPWAGYVHVLGDGGGITREARGVAYRWNVGNTDAQRLDAGLCRVAIAIAEEAAPLTIAPAEEKVWEATIGGALEIPLKIARNGQPKGEWQLAPVGLPGLNKFDPIKIDGAAANEAKLVFNFANKDGNAFVAGTHTFFVRARGVVGYKPDEKTAAKDLKDIEFSMPITVRLGEAATVSATP